LGRHQDNSDGADDTSYPQSDPGSFYDGNVVLTVDNTVDLASDPVTATASGSDITVTVTATEELTLNEFTVANVDGQSAGSFTKAGESPNEYEATISGVSDGSYDVDVTNVEDAAGNTVDPAETDTAAVTVDNVQPSATWDNTGFTVSGSYDLTQDSTVENADTTTYEYTTDGSSYTEITDETSWDTTGLDDGDVDVRITAEDDQGNSDTAETTVTVDNVQPTATWDNTDFTVSGTYDLTQDSTVENADTTTYEYSTDSGSTWNTISDETTWDTTGLADGDVDVRITAEDDQGGSDTATTTVTVDNVQPTATWDNTDFTVSGTYDLTQDSTVENADTTTYEYSTDSGSTWNTISDETTWDTTGLADGDVDVRITAEDDQGGSDTATTTVTVDTTVETTSLTATNDNAQEITVTVEADEQLSDLTASDGSDNSVSGVADTNDFSESVNNDETYTYEATYDAGADGDYTVTLDSASDTNGNSNSSTGLSDSVTVDTTGSFSGKVTNGSGDAIADTQVTFNDSNGNQLGQTTTDANGEYTVEDVEEGTYDITASADGYEDATTNGVEIVATEDTATTDFSLTEITTGSFSGTVTNGSGDAIADTQVTFNDSNGNQLVQTTTDANGEYTVEDVEEGTYDITASADGYEDATTNGVEIVATEDTATTDFSLTEITTGSFSGKVTNGSGDAIADTQVTFNDSNGNQLGQTTTDANGEYTVEDVEEGTYDITASADGYKDDTTNDVEITGEEDTADTDFTLSEAGEVHDVDELQINADFIGIVADDNNTVSLTASGFEDADGYTIVDREVDVNIGDNDYAVTIDENGEVDAEIDPEAISADHETGETDVSVVGADAEDAATDSVTLVHEAHNLNEGWNLKSIPQPAELYQEDVNAVNQWNTGDETYDAGIADGVVSNAGDLHRGMYVDAGADGRLGYEFETDAVPQPGDVQLENGWHLASSNFAIDTDDATRDLDDDLVNLPGADQPGITVYDDVQETTLGGGSTVDAYDTYWVFIDDPERTDRGILAPNYDPTERDGILNPA